MTLMPTSHRTTAYQPKLAWFTAIATFWVFVLVMLGAFTTSIGAGMVFPDWPLSNGSLNPDGWLTDLAMFAEHSHRLSAGLMSLLTIAIAAWIWRADDRGWVRKLALFAVSLVFVQALVGGLRVLLDHLHVEMVNTSVGRLFAMLHACLAQVYVCTLFALSISVSRSWMRPGLSNTEPSVAVRRWGLIACALLLVQLAVAAIMRHSFAGLAIPVFPQSTSEGHWLPQAWDFRVGIHFTHRVLALILSFVLFRFATVIWTDRASGPIMRQSASILMGLLGLQIALGASIIWTGRHPYYTTAHVIVGACTLATAFALTWWAFRFSVGTAAGVAASPDQRAVPQPAAP